MREADRQQTLHFDTFPLSFGKKLPKLPWKLMDEGGQKMARELSLGAVLPTGL